MPIGPQAAQHHIHWSLILNTGYYAYHQFQYKRSQHFVHTKQAYLCTTRFSEHKAIISLVSFLCNGDAFFSDLATYISASLHESEASLSQAGPVDLLTSASLAAKQFPLVFGGGGGGHCISKQTSVYCATPSHGHLLQTVTSIALHRVTDTSFKQSLLFTFFSITQHLDTIQSELTVLSLKKYNIHGVTCQKAEPIILLVTVVRTSKPTVATRSSETSVPATRLNKVHVRSAFHQRRVAGSCKSSRHVSSDHPWRLGVSYMKGAASSALIWVNSDQLHPPRTRPIGPRMHLVQRPTTPQAISLIDKQLLLI
jgi:hypothetical protein